MKIAYFDCFHGAAGDMLLASMLDAGLDMPALEEVLAHLPLDGYTLEHTVVTSHHVRGSRFTVHEHTPQPSRTWADIRAMLETSPLPPRTRSWALAAFVRLAQAEAAVHGVSLDTVHFHEVGAVDSIVDMVGVCAALDLLGIEQVYASPLPTGNGWVETAHGPLPVPAPATLKILADATVPIVPAASSGELLTPTAAALLAELAQFGQPPMQVEHIGYGFGHKGYDRLNGLRVWLGKGTHNHKHHHDHDHPHEHPAPPTVGREAGEGGQPSVPCSSLTTPYEHVVELRCNLDDVTGELVAYTIEQLLAAGALDAWATPLVMKKGRPAVQLSCLAYPTDRDALAQLILHETPTFGVRWETNERCIAERQIVQVETTWGRVRLKQKLIGGKVVSSTPEYDDCADLARATGVSFAQIYQSAIGLYPGN
jgi:uncharacterized protein (TIGR00299 family) protein